MRCAVLFEGEQIWGWGLVVDGLGIGGMCAQPAHSADH